MNAKTLRSVQDAVALAFTPSLVLIVFWLVRTGAKADSIGYGLSYAAVLLATLGISLFMRKLSSSRCCSAEPAAGQTPAPDTNIKLEAAKVLSGSLTLQTADALAGRSAESANEWTLLDKVQTAYVVVSVLAAIPIIVFNIEAVLTVIGVVLVTLGMLVTIGWTLKLDQQAPSDKKPSDGKK